MLVTPPFLLVAALLVGWTAAQIAVGRGPGRAWMRVMGVALTVADGAVALAAGEAFLERRAFGGDGPGAWLFLGAVVLAWAFVRMWLVLGAVTLAARISGGDRRCPG